MEGAGQRGRAADAGLGQRHVRVTVGLEAGSFYKPRDFLTSAARGLRLGARRFGDYPWSRRPSAREEQVRSRHREHERVAIGVEGDRLLADDRHRREEWWNGALSGAFSKRYPAVPMIRASRDPRARQAVYILSRRVGGFVVLDAKGRATIPMIVGVAAPEADRCAYNLLLVLEDGSWRVDRVRRIVVHDSG